MVNFIVVDVKWLRELIGVGMFVCKNVLVEIDGDFDKVVEVLWIKGVKDVGKCVEWVMVEGLVVVKDGVLIEFNCEIDFVVKNVEF